MSFSNNPLLSTPLTASSSAKPSPHTEKPPNVIRKGSNSGVSSNEQEQQQQQRTSLDGLTDREREITTRERVIRDGEAGKEEDREDTEPEPSHSHSHHDGDDNNTTGSLLAVQPASPLQQPFFTVIEDESSSEYYHPTVHYIFSDDDTDIVTEATLRSLESFHQDGGQQTSTGKGGATTPAHGSHRRRRTCGDRGLEEDKRSYQKGFDSESAGSNSPGASARRENCIILDVEPLSESNNILGTGGSTVDTAGTKSLVASSRGTVTVANATPQQPQSQYQPQQQQQQQPQFTVRSARSLTSSWQVLGTQIVPAPTFENNFPENNSEQDASRPRQRGLMLKINGTSGLPPGNNNYVADNNQRLEQMMDQFTKRMTELKSVIEASEKMGGVEQRIEEPSLPPERISSQHPAAKLPTDPDEGTAQADQAS